MARQIAIAVGGTLIVAMAFAGGAFAALSYLAQPFASMETDFSEIMLPAQADALRSLREGAPSRAEEYLEVVTAIALERLAKQKLNGKAIPETARTSEAIDYLCSPASLADRSSRPVARPCAALKPDGKS